MYRHWPTILMIGMFRQPELHTDLEKRKSIRSAHRL